VWPPKLGIIGYYYFFKVWPIKPSKRGKLDKKNQQDRLQEQINPIIALISSGQTQEALDAVEVLIKDYPNELVLFNISGACYAGLGQFETAIKRYEQALAIKPDYADVHNNLGNALLRFGKLDAAVNSLEKALAIKPDYPDAYFNLGNTFQKLGQLDAAVNSYEKAIAIKPDYVEAHYSLGLSLQELGQLDDAVKSFQRVLQLKPEFATMHNNLAVILKELGRFNIAVEHLEKALSIKSDFAEAHNNLGNVLKELDQYDAAVNSYEKAIAIKPDFAEAHFNLAGVLIDIRRIGEAVKSYKSALSFDSNNNFFWDIFSKNLRDIEFLEFSDTTASCLLEALTKPTVKANNLIKPITSILRHNPTFHRVLEVSKSSNVDEKLNYLTEQLSTIPLLLRLMELCPISDPEVEKLLIKIRLSTLNNLSNDHISVSSLPFYEALALHCFTNEYVFLESNEETLKVDQLENEISMCISSKEHISVLKITLLATYRPLHIFSWAEKLLESDSADTLQKIIIRQITEVREEHRLRSQISEINVTENKISQIVREQYEENPYPRWINLGLSSKPKTIREVMQDLRVNLDLNKNQFSTSPKILIAGCGTGQHSLSVASSFQNSSVLAVDLSLNSLSYAMRKTKELSVTNIDYMQGDILKLNTLNRKFDIIESAGVLHHMEEPLVGWQVLVDLLKPQGLMKIALYSDIARQNVVEIREFIAKKGYDNSPKDIRECRAEIMNMPTDSNSRFQTIINSKDFYSLSACRDLLFHVQEHRFTLPQISNALEKMGLIFIGFDCGSQIENQFKALYPSKEDLFSLQLWHQFEQDHPDTFIRMYQFWVQKK